MSIKTTPTTEVTLDTTEVTTATNQEIETTSNEHCVNIVLNEGTINSSKKEYSIIGDSFYTSINYSGTTPQWLLDLVNNLVDSAVMSGLTNYDELVQDVRSAIDSIDVAKNTFVSQVNFTQQVDTIIGTRLQTLNVTNDNKYAQIVDLDTVVVNANEALSLRATDLQAEFSEGINSRITTVQTAYASEDQVLANSIEALTVVFDAQDTQLSGVANAVSGLQTYVGLSTETGIPNGLGLLSRVSMVEKQTDGVVYFTTGTYDVMLGVEDPNTDTSNDNLVVDVLPFILWTNLEGSGEPAATTRPYTDYSTGNPVEAFEDIIENTLYTRSDFSDKDVDKYYRFLSGTWNSIDEAEFNLSFQNTRAAHVGDVYIQYESTSEGSRNYIRSYKFIKTAIDNTSPYSTDSEGYGWALVTDTDAQSIYMTALQAKDIADGKISSFYAWGGINAPADYSVKIKNEEYLLDENGRYLDAQGEVTTNPANYVETVAAEYENVSSNHVVFWFTGGNLYKKGNSWTDKILVPTTTVGEVFISKGDFVTVLDPETNDFTVYVFNGTSWEITSPLGVISKSKWFIDLENEVTNPHGLVARTFNELSVTGKAYADEKSISVENKFSYNSTILLNGEYYKSGFGMNSSGVSQTQDGLTVETAKNSEFWVNAERFILKSPSYPGVQAAFTVTSNGISLGLQYTEATRNEAKGVHSSGSSYLKGDIVTFEGSSYTAKSDVPLGVDVTNSSYWLLLAKAEVQYTKLKDLLQTLQDLKVGQLMQDLRITLSKQLQ